MPDAALLLADPAALALVVLAVLLALAGAAAYNRLVRLRARVEEAWSGLDADLTRRANLRAELTELTERRRDDGPGDGTSSERLEHELAIAEDRLAASRRFLDGNLRAYHAGIATFPTNLVARRLGFPPDDTPLP